MERIREVTVADWSKFRAAVESGYCLPMIFHGEIVRAIRKLRPSLEHPEWDYEVTCLFDSVYKVPASEPIRLCWSEYDIRSYAGGGAGDCNLWIFRWKKELGAARRLRAEVKRLKGRLEEYGL